MEAMETNQTAIWWLRVLLPLALLVLVLALAGPLGYRLGITGVRASVLILPGVSALLAAVVCLGSLLALALHWAHWAPRELMIPGGSLLLALLILGNMGWQYQRATSVPAIHDITTAPEDPPQFVAVLPLRGGQSNALEYDAAKLAEVTRTAYPQVRHIMADLSADEAAELSRTLVAKLGWELVAASDGLIEATHTSAFYGFKDDVAIRIRSGQGAGVRIDLRSVSRVGQSDLGANAARIEAFISAFDAATR